MDVDAEDRRRRFEALAPAMVDPLRRFLLRRTDPDTADEVLADTLLVCWRKVEQLPDEPLPWAYAVARHCLHNAQRGERRRHRLAAKVAGLAQPGDVPGPEPDGDPAVEAALAALRPADAELVRLWAWEQLTPAEIATVLDITPNAASIRLYRARQKLAERLRKNDAGAGHEGSREGRRP